MREKKLSKGDSPKNKNDDSSVKDDVPEEGEDSIVLGYDSEFENSPKKDVCKTSSSKTSTFKKSSVSKTSPLMKKSSSKEPKYEFKFPYTNKTLPSSDISIASAGSKRSSKSDDEKKKRSKKRGTDPEDLTMSIHDMAKVMKEMQKQQQMLMQFYPQMAQQHFVVSSEDSRIQKYPSGYNRRSMENNISDLKTPPTLVPDFRIQKYPSGYDGRSMEKKNSDLKTPPTLGHRDKSKAYASNAISLTTPLSQKRDSYVFGTTGSSKTFDNPSDYARDPKVYGTSGSKLNDPSSEYEPNFRSEMDQFKAEGFVNPKRESRLPRDQADESIVWSFCHFPQAIRVPFTKKYQDKRIEHYLKGRWCTHSTNKDRNQFYLKYHSSVRAYVYRHGKNSVKHPTYDEIGRHLENLGLLTYARNLGYPNRFVQYCIRSMQCSIYCIDNDIEMCKIPIQICRDNRSILIKEIELVREWLLTEPKENDSSHNVDTESNNRTEITNEQDSASYHTTQSSVPNRHRETVNVADATISNQSHFDNRDRQMVKRFDYQTSHLDKDEISMMRKVFINTLHYRYAVIDSNDVQRKLNGCIDDATDFMKWKDKVFNHSSPEDVLKYDTDDVKRKCTVFLNVLAKNISFDVGYWDIVRNGSATMNVGGLCFCPCSRFFNHWTVNMCPTVKTAGPTWPCHEDAYMTVYQLEQHLYDVMRDNPNDMYHTMIALYLIKVYPLANSLLEFNNINNFFVNYRFSVNFNVNFYGFKNMTISHRSRVLDDDISSLGHSNEVIRSQRSLQKKGILSSTLVDTDSCNDEEYVTPKKKSKPKVIDLSSEKTMIDRNINHTHDSVICLCTTDKSGKELHCVKKKRKVVSKAHNNVRKPIIEVDTLSSSSLSSDNSLKQCKLQLNHVLQAQSKYRMKFDRDGNTLLSASSEDDSNNTKSLPSYGSKIFDHEKSKPLQVQWTTSSEDSSSASKSTVSVVKYNPAVSVKFIRKQMLLQMKSFPSEYKGTLNKCLDDVSKNIFDTLQQRARNLAITKTNVSKHLKEFMEKEDDTLDSSTKKMIPSLKLFMKYLANNLVWDIHYYDNTLMCSCPCSNLNDAWKLTFMKKMNSVQNQPL